MEGAVFRRQGRWDEHLVAWERSHVFDPQLAVNQAWDLALTYALLGR